MARLTNVAPEGKVEMRVVHWFSVEFRNTIFLIPSPSVVSAYAFHSYFLCGNIIINW